MSIVNQPYTDQIWTSGCVPFEHSLQQLLTKIIKDKDVIVSLVDSIDSTYLNHPRIVTDNILNILTKQDQERVSSSLLNFLWLFRSLESPHQLFLVLKPKKF